jgi:Clp amino terminal domain, pathogenicity island component
MPPNKMERFTHRARRVLSYAQEEAERFRHPYIGTEHLLLGIIREAGGVGAQVLREMGVELERVEALIVERWQKVEHQPAAIIDLDADMKQVLELAVDEARHMRNHSVDTEHLLLGLGRQSDSAGMEILKQLGIQPENVRRQIRRVMQALPPISQSGASETNVDSTSQDFEFWHIVAGKVLNMTANNQLSVEQAAELLGAFMPMIRVSSGGVAVLVTYLKQPEELERRVARITTKKRSSGEVLFNITIGLKEVRNLLDSIFKAIVEYEAISIDRDDGDFNTRIEIGLDDDKA